ncbi:MAG: ParA family protein [Caldivirga sp.]|nr:ParA family protein [Caldivirga sp.]
MDAVKGSVIIPIISAMGGVGKTTVSLMLAYKAVRDGLNTLILDLDPTAGLTLRVFGDIGYQALLEQGKTLMNLIRQFNKGAKVNLTDYATLMGYARGYGIDVMAEFNEVKVLAPGEEFEEFFAERQYMDVGNIIWNILDKAGVNQFNVVIVDTAPFFDRRYTLIAVRRASKAVVVVRPIVTDIMRTERMIKKLMNFFQEEDRQLPKFIIVFNFDPQRLAREATTVIKSLGIRVFKGEVGEGSKPSFRAVQGEGSRMLERRLRDFISNFKDYVEFSRYAIPYFKAFGDDFPHESIKKSDVMHLELAMNQIMRFYGLEGESPYEEEEE